MTEQKRFQECNLLTKLWRLRHYLPIPFNACQFWFHNAIYANDSHHLLSFRTCWSICIGIAQSKMGWYYTWEETKKRLEKKFSELDKNNVE